MFSLAAHFISYILFHQVVAVYECTAGLWGPQCTKTCGFCEGGPEFCQVYDGFCINGCASGHQGANCKEPCPPGQYGQYCVHLCGFCSEVSPVCDPKTGKCLVGCQPGFQMPHCKTECAFKTWGKDCGATCDCKNETGHDCGCNHLTGLCFSCEDYHPHIKKVTAPECLNQHVLAGNLMKYEPPSVLNFPYKPILAVASTVSLFVFGNFLWWWFMVRTPSSKQVPHIIRRDPRKMKLHSRTKLQTKYKNLLREVIEEKTMPKELALSDPEENENSG